MEEKSDSIRERENLGRKIAGRLIAVSSAGRLPFLVYRRADLRLFVMPSNYFERSVYLRHVQLSQSTGTPRLRAGTRRCGGHAAAKRRPSDAEARLKWKLYHLRRCTAAAPPPHRRRSGTAARTRHRNP